MQRNIPFLFGPEIRISTILKNKKVININDKYTNLKPQIDIVKLPLKSTHKKCEKFTWYLKYPIYLHIAPIFGFIRKAIPL